MGQKEFVYNFPGSETFTISSVSLSIFINEFYTSFTIYKYTCLAVSVNQVQKFKLKIYWVYRTYIFMLNAITHSSAVSGDGF